MWRVSKLKKQFDVFFFVIWNVSEKHVNKNSADLMLNSLPQKTPRNTVVGNAKNSGASLPAHIKKFKNDQKPVMFGQYQQLNPSCDKGQDERKSKLFCQYMRNWLTSLVDTFSSLTRFVAGEKPTTLKQTVSTPRINSPFIWSAF